MMLLPMMAMADAVEIDGIYYNLITKGKIAEVTSNPNKYSGSVAIPEKVQHEGTEYSVTSIGNNAFYDCKNLTSITIPNSVTSIGVNAFRRCSGLTSVTIGNSVTSIGDYAFDNCNSLTSVYISDLETWCKISFAKASSNPLCCAHHLFLNGEEIKDLEIPNNVTSINNSAFFGCSGLTSITIPNSVTSIGERAFENCSGLTSVTIGNNVTSINNSAFLGCSGLTSITIPNSVTSIGERAFENCSGLTSVTIGNSVTSVGEYAFYGCSSLTSITIPNSVTSIKQSTFGSCSSLASITIPNSVTSIEYYAFSGCTGLTSITIPNSVTNIGGYAFQYCSGLTSITIGGGVKTIGSYAFANCPELADVFCYAENAPSTSTNAFEGSYVDYATLHVPDASIDLYKAAEPWKNFKEIVGLDGTVPVEPEKCATPTIQVVDGKLKFICETEGVTFKTTYKVVDSGNNAEGDEVIMGGIATCQVSVYATKDGYEDSDVATANVEIAWGKKGDVNADGEVNVGDIVTTTNIMAGKDE